MFWRILNIYLKFIFFLKDMVALSEDEETSLEKSEPSIWRLTYWQWYIQLTWALFMLREHAGLVCTILLTCRHIISICSNYSFKKRLGIYVITLWYILTINIFSLQLIITPNTCTYIYMYIHNMNQYEWQPSMMHPMPFYSCIKDRRGYCKA